MKFFFQFIEVIILFFGCLLFLLGCCFCFCCCCCLSCFVLLLLFVLFCFVFMFFDENILKPFSKNFATENYSNENQINIPFNSTVALL